MPAILSEEQIESGVRGGNLGRRAVQRAIRHATDKTVFKKLLDYLIDRHENDDVHDMWDSQIAALGVTVNEALMMLDDMLATRQKDLVDAAVRKVADLRESHDDHVIARSIRAVLDQRRDES